MIDTLNFLHNFTVNSSKDTMVILLLNLRSVNKDFFKISIRSSTEKR